MFICSNAQIAPTSVCSVLSVQAYFFFLPIAFVAGSHHRSRAQRALSSLTETFNVVVTNEKSFTTERQINGSSLAFLLSALFPTMPQALLQPQSEKLIEIYDKHNTGGLDLLGNRTTPVSLLTFVFTEFVEMVHFANFWSRFQLDLPLAVREEVLALARKGSTQLQPGTPGHALRALSAAFLSNDFVQNFSVKPHETISDLEPRVTEYGRAEICPRDQRMGAGKFQLRPYSDTSCCLSI